MKRHYTISTHPILSSVRSFFLLYSVFILSSGLLSAEGIHQLAPSPDDQVMLLIGDNNYGNFATLGSPESSRLYIQMNGPDETLYIGLSREYSESGSASGTGSYAFSIRRADDGQIVHGPYSMNSFVENLSSWEDASGPAVLNGGQGYDTDSDRFRFNPTEAGLYYIEFTNASYIGLWDFTVGANNVAIPGRVYSKNWAFRTPTVTNSSPECVWDREFSGAMYSYTNDGFVTRIDFANSGFQGLSFAMAFNTRGPGDSGDVGLDRMSIADENATSNLAEHLIFLQEPDPLLYPDGDCGGVNIESFFECTGQGTYCLDVSVTQAGQVEVIIDINQNGVYDPEIDRSILHRFDEGESLTSCIPWDGRLADGSEIDPGANVNVLVTYNQGVQHWSLFDGEFLKEGFCVEPIRPICNNSGLTNILYWDDRNIPEDPGTGQPKDGRQGCSCETVGCRTWDNFETNLEDCAVIDDNVTTGYGDKSSLNTWWFANVVRSNIANIPLISVDLQGEEEICVGTTTNLSFVFTSTADIASITWEGPSGIIASGADAPLNIDIDTPGTYSISLTDSGGCTFTDTHIVTGTTCPTDLALDITADVVNPSIGSTVTFTITVINEGEYNASNFSIASYWPAGLENIQIVTAGGNLNVNTLTWDELDLTIGESLELVFTGEVSPAFEYVISAEVFEHNQGDVDSSPNSGVDTNNNGQCADDDGDEDDGDCVELFPPSCDITTSVTNILCDANGTFEDPSDDTFTFSLTVNGSNGSSGWAGQIGGQAHSGNYGETIDLGPYPISGGAIELSVNDNFYSISCIITQSVTPPLPCSDNCLMILEAEESICDNNNTPFDPSDDTFSFRFRISGANTGGSWWASDGSVGNYDTWYTYADYPISVGNRTLSFIDIADGSCSATQTFLAPPTCSSDCLLAADIGEAVCDDNDTPSDPSDDTFTFTLTMGGVNNGTTWTSDDPLSSSGNYNFSQLMGPYPISGGDLNFTIADGDDETCTALINVAAPATCSDLCVIALEQMTPVCDDNGSVSEGSDDTYTVEVRLTGANTSEGWTASDGTTGAYNEWVTMGPYLISDGDQNIDFSDNADGNCTESTVFVAPPACSTTCVITADVSDPVCDNNGTPSDPSDDTFRFTLTVSGANTASTWSANDPMASSGNYGDSRLMGPYPISGGDLSFTITDGDDNDCTAIVIVAAPATCSDLCVIALEQMTPVCDDNGSVSEGSDDTYTVEVRLTGANTSEGWTASDGTTGAYNEWVTMGPYLISDGDQNINFSDNADGDCTESTIFVAPPACSTTCVITADVSDPVCDNNGTPSDPSDDTFRFTLTVSGANTASTWSANDPLSSSGIYNDEYLMGPYPISGGDLNFTITDGGDETCTALINVAAPATCSDLCVIALEQMTPICDDNGSVSEGSDDTYTVEVRLTGANTSEGWTASDGTTGAYNEWVTMGPYLISDGDQNIDFSDNADGNCTESTVFVAPPACSTTCVITADVSDPVCDNNGTPSDPSDDTFRFTLTVSGANTASTWSANDPMASSGNYGDSRLMGPYPISGGDLSFTITDGDDNDCTFLVAVEAPATCSDLCVINAELTGGDPVCDPNGTMSDSSDDTFSFELTISGLNTSGGWVTTDGQSGDYNEATNFGPYAISDGTLTLVFQDEEDENCTTIFSINPPATCSDECLINTPVVSAISCNDNGTSTDPSDDTYTFVVVLDGFNLGAQWEANDGAIGTYGTPTTFGPYAIADGDVELTFTDLVTPDCSVSVQVEAPLTCSEECAIAAFTSNYQCLDNDTPADPSDDLFTFDLRVEPINNTGSGWIQPSGNAGTYGETYTQGPFPISNGSFEMTVQDVEDSSCTTSVVIEPTATCSNECLLMVDLISVDCDDNGTEDDSSDDVFVYTVSVNAVNATGGWIASDGTSGAFGEIVTSIGHDYSEGEIEITIMDSEELCSATFNVTPPRPGLICPEDTDQRSYRGSVQILSGSWGVGDSVVSEAPCFLSRGSIPMTFGDRFMVPVDIFTPEPLDGGGDEVYTFYLFSDVDMPAELAEYGPGDGAGMLFRGDYSGYADPCCFSQGYMPTGFSTGETVLGDPFVDTTGMFEDDMYLVQRFKQNLKMGQEFSLVTTTYGAGATGNYNWLIVSDVQDSLVINSEEVISEFLPDQPITEDLTHFDLPWVQDSIESLPFVGEPTVLPYCGVDSLYFFDELFYGDSCLSATIDRSFVLTSAGISDTCVQELTFRRPVFEDIILPPATATFNCGDDYTPTPEGYPSPQDTGYPLLDNGVDYIPIISEIPVLNLAVSYKDIPNLDTIGLLVDLVREWTVVDVCNGDTLYVIPQLIKVGEFDLPTITCPSTTHPCTCPRHDGFILFDVDQFECTATIDVPYPELRGFCDESRAEEWSITTEIISQETDIVVATILEEESRSVASVERGDYWLHYIAEDNDGNRVEQSCAMRVADLQHPTASCRSTLTIVLDDQTSEQTIDVSQLDLNSYDNCTVDPTLLLRRFYPDDINECSDQTGGVFGEWSENTAFYCCDANRTFQVELQVMDADSNSNYCVVEVNIVDETVPQLSGLEDLVISCSELPASFDPDDSASLSSLFGMPEAFDNCLVEIEEMTPVVSWNNCELGSIHRSFHATDYAGNSNPVAYEQNITVNAENSYGIRFARDIETDCIDGLAELQIDAIGCGDFEISYIDEDIEQPTAGCLQIQRTYRIFNSCTYDGVSEPTTISRSVNCNAVEGTDDVWLVIRDGIAYLDADNEPNNSVPAAGAQDPACGINPMGYWQSLNNVGAWEYTQLITINDDTAPVLSIVSPEPFCTLDNTCEGPVNISFTAVESCLPERVKLSLFLDQDNDESIDADLTNTGALTGEWPNYRIQGDYPIGSHAFILEAEDGCGNTVSERIPFDVADCYIEQPNCLTDLQVQLSPIVPAVDLNGDGIADEGAIVLSATLLAEVSGVDCSGNYGYSIQQIGATPVFSDDNLILTCEDRYSVTREVTIRDNAYNPYAVQPDGSMGGPNYTHCTIQVSVQDSFSVCASCVQEELEIEGVIRRQGSLEPVSGVTVQILIDDELESQEFTVEDGKYEFPDLAFSNNYEVRPYKNDDTPNGVTTLDLIILQRHLLQLSVITDPYQLLAADINASGTVTTLDLIQMQALLLGNSTTFPSNTSWRFLLADFPLTDIAAEIPDSYVYYNLVSCQFGQDFTAVKIGDLNGSASAEGQLVQDDNLGRSTWPLFTVDQEMKAGESYRIPIIAADLERLSGLEISLQLAPSKINVLEIEPGLIRMSELNTNLLSRGVLKAIWLADKTPTFDQTLFTLIVSAEENTSLASALKLQSNASSRAYDQELQVYDFELSYLEREQEILLLANKPDPFKNFTEVEFFLPENGQYRLELTDVTGRVVQQFQEEATRGYHQIRIDGSDLPSGILYYRLIFDEKQITRRMLKL